MGTTVEFNVYRLSDLVTAIIDTPKTRNKDKASLGKIRKILLGLGEIYDDIYVTLWDEYADEYNSATQCMNFLCKFISTERYYGMEDLYDLFAELKLEGISKYTQHNSADEFADEEGLQLLPMEDED